MHSQISPLWSDCEYWNNIKTTPHNGEPSQPNRNLSLHLKKVSLRIFFVVVGCLLCSKAFLWIIKLKFHLGELINFSKLEENAINFKSIWLDWWSSAREKEERRRILPSSAIKTLSVFGIFRRLNNNKIKALPDNLLASMPNLVRV